MHLCGRHCGINDDEESISEHEDGQSPVVESLHRMKAVPTHGRCRSTPGDARRSRPAIMGDAEEEVHRMAVPRLVEENSIDQFESIVETLQQYQLEIVEESGLLFKNTITFLITVIVDYITDLCAFPYRCFKSAIQDFHDVFLMKPVDEKFDYSGLAIGYFWSCVTLKAKCWGEIFASTQLGYAFLCYLFPNPFLFVLLLYILLPRLAKLVHLKTPQNVLSKGDRRLLILVFAFIIGAGTHFALLNWHQPALPPPPFFSPTIVALVVEFIGPLVCKRRCLFVGLPIGLATIVCILYGIEYDIFDFTYFYLTFLTVALSCFNFQLMLAGSDKGPSDPIMCHLTLPINSMYNQLITTLLLGNYSSGRDVNDVVPDSIEEQYSILSHK
ncbi:hypothetical protein Tcan_16429 [Toxocara canis]|uniref:Uncharacterized protein n=1 Tax=Toxocara canis TaxID=6265 RepID=A0A0B2UVN7_TOXCA|nr:hypothetical protein Tcan_16429 [Toxocara canis]